MPRHNKVRTATIGSIALFACSVSAAPQEPADVEALLMRVAERVVDYYHRAQSVVCVERSIVQPIRPNWTLDGFSRTVESELRVESEPTDGGLPPRAQVVRDVRRINGRAPREQDKTDRSACTDPNPLSPEPLSFLLASQRRDYRFISVREGRERGRAAFIIEFMSANRKSRPVLIADERGHDDCFDWTGPLAARGRVWVDAETHDVLRVDRRIDGPVDVQVPLTLQRRYELPAWIVLERDDMMIRYRPAAFSTPDEVLLLPDSVESLTIVRSALQSTRRTETFSHYRRFLTTGRLVKDP
jgi:hypothetical protein